MRTKHTDTFFRAFRNGWRERRCYGLHRNEQLYRSWPNTLAWRLGWELAHRLGWPRPLRPSRARTVAPQPIHQTNPTNPANSHHVKEN